MTPDLHQRARNVLAQLSVVSEGKTSIPDPIAQSALPIGAGSGLHTRISDPRPPVGGHAPAEGREPVNLETIDLESSDGPPSPYRSLHDHWKWKFDHARSEEVLHMYVLLAEEALLCARHPGKRGAREVTEGDLLAFRGPPAEAAAKFTVQMAYMRTLRLRNRQDPETGDPWLWPPPEKESGMSKEARQRAKLEAEEKARAMLAEGASQRRVSETVGIPGRTLRRMLAGERNPD